jgi:glucose-1-phosphate thymidylyltransferase
MAPLQALEGRSRVPLQTNSPAPFAYHSRMASPSPDQRPEKAVILARGLGTRMRKPDAGAALDPAQHAAAGRGQKAMMPLAGGRPFLDYVLSGLADAGYARVCLVIGPGPDPVRAHYAGPGRPARVRLEFAVQDEARGTADAVLSAEPFASGDPFLLVNADNLYPRAALEALRALPPPRAGVAAFRRSVLVAGGIPAERILAFALLGVDRDGWLTEVVEKPGGADAARFGDDPLVSMNAWLLPPAIFKAARAIGPSPRGELELQDAVRHAVARLGERFRAVEIAGAVLDLSTRGDIAAAAERLRGIEPRP